MEPIRNGICDALDLSWRVFQDCTYELRDVAIVRPHLPPCHPPRRAVADVPGRLVHGESSLSALCLLSYRLVVYHNLTGLEPRIETIMIKQLSQQNIKIIF